MNVALHHDANISNSLCFWFYDGSNEIKYRYIFSIKIKKQFEYKLLKIRVKFWCLLQFTLHNGPYINSFLAQHDESIDQWLSARLQ